ncbi:MFS transporter [Bacillus cereus]|uniref:MFS transporter n=2 Tax=Bacillus cereus group TaxID=86661 RepID=UPI00138E70A0|nr:MFS transporter [Bacillus cereus]
MMKRSGNMGVNNKKWVIYLMSLLIGVTMGILNPMVSTHITFNNVSEIWVGILASGYFFFIALASVIVGRFLINKDLKKLIIFGLALSAVCTALFPFVSGVLLWFILYSLTGVGIGFYMIGSQTILHKFADEKSLGVVSGIYTMNFAIGTLVGVVIGSILYGIHESVPFLMTSVALVLASLLLATQVKGSLVMPGFQGKNVLGKIKLALVGVCAYAIVEAVLVSLYPSYLIRYDYSTAEMGLAVGMFIIGTIIGTLPFSHLADKMGREKALIISGFVAIVGLIGVMTIEVFYLKLLVSFIAGFGIGPIYPISMALTTQNLKLDELQSGTAMFIFFYGIGSTIGPVLSSMTMVTINGSHVFTLSLALFIILVVSAFARAAKSNVPLAK